MLHVPWLSSIWKPADHGHVREGPACLPRSLRVLGEVSPSADSVSQARTMKKGNNPLGHSDRQRDSSVGGPLPGLRIFSEAWEPLSSGVTPHGRSASAGLLPSRATLLSLPFPCSRLARSCPVSRCAPVLRVPRESFVYIREPQWFPIAREAGLHLLAFPG